MPDENAPATGEQKPAEPKDDKTLGPAGEKALEEWKARAKKAEAEAKQNAERLKALEDKDKSELEKAQGQVAELTKAQEARDASIKSLRLSVAVMGAAGQHGITDPDAAQRLLDADKVEYDESGQPTNIEPLLKGLVEARPYLTAGTRPQGSANGGEGGGRPNAEPTMNDMIRQQAGYST